MHVVFYLVPVVPRFPISFYLLFTSKSPCERICNVNFYVSSLAWSLSG